MTLINWQQFGLKKDPYDTQPLVEGGDLKIEDAFVGRDKERQFLNGLFESESRGCLAILGNVGVGKTSLANFHKFIWKYSKPKLFFSFRREIEACEELLNKKNFLIEIIASILREIRLLQPELLKEKLLDQLNKMVDFSQANAISGGFQAFGFGLEAGRESVTTQPMQMSIATLEQYFIDLIAFIKKTEIKGKKYSGLVVHVNNFDVVLEDPGQKKRAIQFFNEVRDLLQTSDVFFLFLGPKNFFRDIISSQQRVKSVFVQTPLQLSPLSKTEIVEALAERMKLLKSDDVSNFIKPIEDEVIFRLYDLYEGDVRSIMAAIRDILGQQADKLTQPLTVSEAMLLLGQERWNQIENANQFTGEQKSILKFLIDKGEVAQKDVSKMLDKAQSNISGYYFKPLKDSGIIEEKRREGKTVFWGLTNDYAPLRWLFESQKKLHEEMDQKTEQMKLF
jgi:Cdc6-like AAA superfamily ATPase